MESNNKKPNYDEEPVYYCEDCLDLCIKSIVGISYCMKCGGTSIAVAKDIFEWQKLYKEKYNKDF